MATNSQYFRDVLTKMGITPTASNVGFLVNWAGREGVPQNIDPYNLLGTTLQVNGSHGTNGPGVQAYHSYADGVGATASMLSQGNFAGIRAALASGNPSAYRNNPELAKEFSSWSGGGYTWPTASGNPNAQLPASGATAGAAPGNPAALAGALMSGQVSAPQDPMQSFISYVMANNTALMQRAQPVGYQPF